MTTHVNRTPSAPRDVENSRLRNPLFHDFTGEWADGLLVVNQIDAPANRARTGAVWRCWDTDRKRFVYLRTPVLRRMQEQRASELAGARSRRGHSR